MEPGDEVEVTPQIYQCHPTTLSNHLLASALMSKRGAYVIVGLLASAAFCCSLALGNLFFENLSLNNDEAVYVLEAQMFGQGDVTLSDSAHGDAFRPWMSGRVEGDRLVLVQQPTLPALMALSEALFGTMRIALAVIAAAAVVAMYALTNALLRDLRIAVVASACFVMSPLVMVQSAMFLSYVLAVSLTAASLALLTRGLDRQTQGQRFRPWLVGAGLFEGLLLCTRPLEGIIFGAVIFTWTLLRSANVRIALRSMTWVYVASTPLLIVALAYNSFTTGDPFTFALWTIGGDDSFGFGIRSIAEHSQFIHVGPWEAWLALRVNLRAFPHWIVGGVVSVPLAVWGASRLWTISRSVFWLVIVQLCLTPFAYFFYYGNYLIIGGRNLYGPHYYLSLLLPMMVLLGVGLVDLAGRRRVLLPSVIGAMALGMAIEIPDKVNVNISARDAIAAEVALVESTVEGPAIVLIPKGKDGPYILHPWGAFSNPPSLDSDVLFAVDLGPRSIELVERFPNRRFYRFGISGEGNSADPSTTHMGPFIEPLTVVSGSELNIEASARRIDRVSVDNDLFRCSSSTSAIRIEVALTTTTVAGCTEIPIAINRSAADLRIFAGADNTSVAAYLPIGRLPQGEAPNGGTQRLATFAPPSLNEMEGDSILHSLPSLAVPWFDLKITAN